MARTRLGVQIRGGGGPIGGSWGRDATPSAQETTRSTHWLALSLPPLAAATPLPFSAMMVLKMASSLGTTTSAFW
ncbi:hypothetical protein FJTKL_05861 [Diaporthe vaccinii]|uniref:Uncharacterized protein n=1 Tax=Diaporthe vaccinii TaxID=105482 RepID=A0ABR4EY57_9PEZI